MRPVKKECVLALGILSQVPGFVVGFVAGMLALGVMTGYMYAAELVTRLADWCES